MVKLVLLGIFVKVHLHLCLQKDGELKPGAKGLSLSAEQWALISSARAAITKALVDKKLDYELDLGGMRKVSVSQFKGKTNINMREYYEKDGELKPGVAFHVLLVTFTAMQRNLPRVLWQLWTAKECVE